eukprot:6930353-Prorocentrum_lima.AAC.1
MLPKGMWLFRGLTVQRPMVSRARQHTGRGCLHAEHPCLTSAALTHLRHAGGVHLRNQVCIHRLCLG